MHLPSLIAKARRSPLSRWWLDIMLPFAVPFNRPHGFKVVPLPDGGISVRVPYWRINRNHIKGIHACALATAAELCSGLSLLEHLDPQQYRLIMRELRMHYHYQAKRTTVASTGPTGQEIADKVVRQLESTAAIDYTSTVELKDVEGRAIATGTITWQVKAWSEVRTKV